MIILSIETSCDETGISVLEVSGEKNPRLRGQASFRVLADSLASQIKIHAPYGGVYPMLAKREHIKNLPILLGKVLEKLSKQNLSLRSLSQGDGPRMSKFGALNYATLQEQNFAQIDLIAVTSGPGLEPALWTGIVFAKELAEEWGVPVIGVNHMEGHIFSVFAKQNGKKFSIPNLQFPMLSLLVSGGHTELVLVKDWLKYKVIGETLDDAAGEAFDKVARMLGLPYPGGPEISKLAERERKSFGFGGRQETMLSRSTDIFLLKNSSYSRRRAHKSSLEHSFSLPRPMLHSKNFDFSFSGLKTAVLYLVKKIGKLDDKTKAQIALEFENAVVETLVYKTKKAIEKYKIETLIVAGGVSANKYLKREIRLKLGKDVKILFPEKKLTTDNSIMIGIVGYLQYEKNKGRFKRKQNIKATGNLRL